MERHHCLNFFPLTTKSTIQPKKWRTHSLIFLLEITSQPFNQQYGDHTWEILPLSFSKIQSQPVNQEKRTHHILRQWICQWVERHHCLKFFYYIQVNHSPKEMAHTQFDFLMRNQKSTIQPVTALTQFDFFVRNQMSTSQPAKLRPHMRNFAFEFF